MDHVNVSAKFEVRSFTRSGENTGYAHGPFSLKFLMGFSSDGPCECTGRICCPYIALPVPEIMGGTQNFGQLLDAPFKVIQGR